MAARGTGRGRRLGLTRDKVIAAAVTMIDRDGPESFSCDGSPPNSTSRACRSTTTYRTRRRSSTGSPRRCSRRSTSRGGHRPLAGPGPGARRRLPGRRASAPQVLPSGAHQAHAVRGGPGDHPFRAGLCRRTRP
ncbi:hypothetical protein NKH77_08625 [Streptomyces sp. M19]